MSRFADIKNTMSRKIKREGLRKTFDATRGLLRGRKAAKIHSERNPDGPTFFDIVFINGCDYSVPHPVRYRVDHQMQQVEASGLTTSRVDAWHLTLDHITTARNFVFFRCPFTPFIGEFIECAKKLNKRVYFDIDDLVVDRKYTDTITYLDTMSSEERACYDHGVDLMGETLRACGRAITTTEGLAVELSNIVPEVFVNRNTASEDMLYYSNRAVHERDKLPYIPDSKIAKHDIRYRNWARMQQKKRSLQGFVIGYFSGSITHNDDFNMVLPSIIRVLEARPQVKLRVVGELDIPKELEPYRERVLQSGFCAWEQLAELLASVDVSIAPLRRSVFNEAKSENKWVEASLVKVPTVASRVGAFERMIEDGETGFLCDTEKEWESVLLDLVDNPTKRHRVAEAAYQCCSTECIAVLTGGGLVDYLRKNQTPNVLMILPSFNISGGVLVALQHCCFLQDAGYDVSLADDTLRHDSDWFKFRGHTFPVLRVKSAKNIDDKLLVWGFFDQVIATFWQTVFTLEAYPRVGTRKYLVQNFEVDFYTPPTTLRCSASSTYGKENLEYLTVSRWCESWLADRYKKHALYVPNGIDTGIFYFQERSFYEGQRVRILIEGDCSSYYKNVDEAFEIVELLDADKYEVWYVSYHAEPKKGYRVDRFLHKVSPDKMADVYRSCHILLKTSILESFSYPPLEMMSTGGYVVAAPNEGNLEYLVDEENCLLYKQGSIKQAASQIGRIVDDVELRQKLLIGGQKTAAEREWESVKKDILDLYC